LQQLHQKMNLIADLGKLAWAPAPLSWSFLIVMA
jgi:hypothetical protein